MSEKSKEILKIAGIIFLAVFFLVLSWDSALIESPTFDEPVHLCSGYSYWTGNDYRMNPENGNFPQRWAALPLLFRKLNPPSLYRDPIFESNQWLSSHEFFYKLGNPSDALFADARFMMILISLLTGLSVFIVSKKIFGWSGAFVSLFFFVFSSNMIGNGHLAVSDMSAALGFILSAVLASRLLSLVDIKGLLGLGAALSLLFLSKMSAPIIVPAILIMLLLKLRSATPLVVKLFRKEFHFRAPRGIAAFFCLSLLFSFLLVYLSIWASYGFRFAMCKGDTHNESALNWQMIQKNESGFSRGAIDFMRERRLFPEAYLYGYQYVIAKSKHRCNFLRGERSLSGRWYFFPYVFIVKSPLPFLLLLAAAIFLIVCARGGKTVWESCQLENSGQDSNARNTMQANATLMSLGILCAVYLLFAVASRINIGLRHILLLYPAAFIFMGSLGRFLISGKNPFLRSSILILMAVYAFEALWIHPHHLAYFNQLAGGPSNGYKELVDSSLDWGQNLPSLKKWLEEHNRTDPDKIYLSYFGTASLPHYIKGRVLPSYMGQASEPFKLGAGTYCVSATMLSMIYLRELFQGLDYGDFVKTCQSPAEIDSEMETLFSALGKQDRLKRLISERGESYWLARYRLYSLANFIRVAKYLQGLEPTAQPGYSTLIYELKQEDIEKAMKIAVDPSADVL